MTKRRDGLYASWITDDDTWSGSWAVYECRCSANHTWVEVMPTYALPDVCPACGMVAIVGPGVSKEVNQ